ncbi:ferredoxin [Methanofollis sp. W23]|nr:ferredoxin [Methanofollis sp. W23]
MEDGIAVIDKNLCTDCGTCVDVCPAEAIQME